MDEYRELLLGCGRARDKRIWPKETHRRAGDHQFGPGLVTADCNQAVNPDWYVDLSAKTPWIIYPRDRLAHTTGIAPLVPLQSMPLTGPYQAPYRASDDYWDEIHAYEVLEHVGRQGDATALLLQFAEIWRMLKPGGYFCATVPSRYSGWLWGDPSHRRAILPQTLVFLDQSEYVKQCDGERPTSMSDFRSFYRADFQLIESADNRETFSFILQAVKPTRWRNPVCFV
jgi:SAM-dependent methyltransferase